MTTLTADQASAIRDPLPYLRSVTIVDRGIPSHDPHVVPVLVPTGPVWLDGQQIPGVASALAVEWDLSTALVVTLAVLADAVHQTDRTLTLGRGDDAVEVMCPIDPVGPLMDHPFLKGIPQVYPVRVFCSRLNIVGNDVDVDALHAT